MPLNCYSAYIQAYKKHTRLHVLQATKVHMQCQNYEEACKYQGLGHGQLACTRLISHLSTCTDLAISSDLPRSPHAAVAAQTG